VRFWRAGGRSLGLIRSSLLSQSGVILVEALWGGVSLARPLLAIAVYKGPGVVGLILKLSFWLISGAAFGVAAWRPSFTALVIRLAIISRGLQ